jgi:peptide/nickel transport system permease protein
MTGLRVQGSGFRRSAPRLAGIAILMLFALGAIFAPWIAPHDPRAQFAEYPYAPPMRLHVIDDEGRWHAPFAYRLVLVDRLERRYLEDRSQRVPLVVPALARPSRQASGSAPGLNPEPSTLNPFLLGTDPLGRDVLSRLLHGARASLGIACAATLGALLIGTLAGALAGHAGGWIDEGTMRIAEFVLVLPAIYVVLALRAVMPLVLEPAEVFAGLATVLALAGWPIVARGVRAIVATERTREYADAARAAGATSARVLRRHLLPAARGFLGTQAALLVPAFVLAEATLSFVGLGFAEPIPSWGTMLQDAGHVRAFGEFPWLAVPAVSITIVSFAINISTVKTYTERQRVQF